MEKGYLALVLHAHLPFVRHPESERYLEERWLFEAVTETYIPLLQMFHGLIRDEVDFRVTMSLTPTLLSMLTDGLLQNRCLRYLQQLIELAEKEMERTALEPEFHQLAENYLQRFTSIKGFYQDYKGNLVAAFHELQQLGKLELITSAATHAFLPLVLTEEAIRAQIKTAVDLHEQMFECKPRGIWLPECGFTPDLDRILRDYGIEYFFTDAHGVAASEPAPVFGTLSPVVTPYGVAAFARDQGSSQQVWSSHAGYPGDVDYREYYRDIGYDLDFETIRPYIHPDGIRIHTGIKYYRITGDGQQKEPYNPENAREKAAQHAGNFLDHRQKQIEHWKWHMGRKPIVVAPYDAELFGHWWYEGPVWIDLLIRKIHFDQDTFKMITPSDYLQLYPDYQVCSLPMSSWGRDGYADVWLRGENDWIYPALHQAETRMIELANGHHDPATAERRALNQAARELMLAQSSDWAFIMDSKTMVDYAVKRTKYHINRFTRLYEAIKSGTIQEKWLTGLERVDNLFPNIDYRVYQSPHTVSRALPGARRPIVLMLSWEFPPMTVGGLSRHVYDLSRHLVQSGWDVHVVTTEIGDCPHDELVEGVHVHRVHVLKPDGDEFIHWAFQLNLMMIDTIQTLSDAGLSFDLIHAHDWLVCQAANTIKAQYGLPLIATIHATEHGRNQGIHTDLQQQIHDLEWRLTYEATRVIVCSTYMQREVQDIFSLPAEKLDVLRNGVDAQLLQIPAESRDVQAKFAPSGERLVLFVGRLVREKGVHILLEAAASILSECAGVKFVIVGQGPSQQELEQLAVQLGIREQVQFTGFIVDDERNWLLQHAELTVFPSLYEPFGIVVLEAMAAGTPTVVSDVGGLGDIVLHGHNGLKMYPGDAVSLALQVKHVLNNPEWARRLSDTALKEIDKYDWHHIASETIDVYQRVLMERQVQNAAEEIAVSNG